MKITKNNHTHQKVIDLLRIEPEIITTYEIQKQLSEHMQLHRAIHLNLRTIIRSSFQQIKFPQQEKILFLRVYFQKLLQQVLQKKAEKIQTNQIKKAILLLQTKKNQKQKQIKKIADARIHYQKKLLKVMINQWKKQTQIQLKYRQLQLKIKGQRFKEFQELLSHERNIRVLIQQQKYEANQILSDFYQKTLLKHGFLYLIFNSKISRFQKKLRNMQFPKILKQIRIFNRTELQKVITFQRNYCLKINFNNIKEHSILAKSLRFQKSRFLLMSFKNWMKYVKQNKIWHKIQESNEILVENYLKRKNTILEMYIWQKWKQCTYISIENKHHNSIIKQYAETKNKQTILRKYFHMLRVNMNNSKINRQFYQVKLKHKVIQSFQINLFQNAKKIENTCEFVKRREIKRYFDGIRSYGNETKFKINRFLLKKAYNAFTIRITFQYYQQNKKAICYHQKNLLYKTIFSFKKEVEVRGKEKYLIKKINVINVLRRWRANHTINQYLFSKKWRIQKNIFREWKLIIIRNQIQSNIQKSENDETSFFAKFSQEKHKDIKEEKHKDINLMKETQTINDQGFVEKEKKKVKKKQSKKDEKKIGSKATISNNSSHYILPTWSTPSSKKIISTIKKQSVQ